VHNLYYTPTTVGVKVEGELHLGINEQKGLNTTDLDDIPVTRTLRFFRLLLNLVTGKVELVLN
jgi:hypothetical protein